ncbi:extracellular solute-binding protein [Trinickia sp. NRRL B-1857]|uniref:extracellular solute-binding protein n=1 Tax=Trinickia sp. NRRL B-1857 TaxID=3162879 RepID=UPI003D27F890
MTKKRYLCAILGLIAATRAFAAGELHIGNWPDYMPPALLAQFQKETGIKAVVDVYDSDASLMQKLQAGSGGYDVAITGDYYVPILARAGLLTKLDKSKLPNEANIKAEYRHPSFDPQRNYAMPYMIVITGYSYDSARVPGGRIDDSWKTFFDPPAAVQGQIADLDAEEELYMAASWYLGQDECSEKPADAKRVLDVLEKQKPFVKTYSDDGPIDRIVSKQVIVQHNWNGASVRATEQLSSVKFVIPKEGARMLQDNLVIPAKANNLAAAYRFVNWMMRPEIIAQASNALRYNNEIAGSERFMNAALIHDPAVTVPADQKARLRPYRACSPQALDLRNKVWVKLKG